MTAAELFPDIVLTPDQQDAYDAFVRFLLDPHDDVFVLAGYSGTGKTTLVRKLLEDVPKFEKLMRLVDDSFKGWDMELTATTNKAAEAFQQITKRSVTTIHYLLGLSVVKDPGTWQTKLIARRGGISRHGKVIFIDEASYIDYKLLRFIMSLCQHSKIVFIGDPAQLTPVESADTPVFTKGFKGAHLTQVVRQAEGNPIISLSTLMRDWVNGGEPPQFRPNGVETQWLPRAEFNARMHQEFTDPAWKHNTSKYLAWTNKACIATNHMVNAWVTGTPEFQVGDYAVNNKFMPGKWPLKTDQTVYISHIESRDWYMGDVVFPGFDVRLDDLRTVFISQDPADRARAEQLAKANKEWAYTQRIEEEWADLRSVFACTINKAQGSTYKRVFIDLDDIGKCRNLNLIARLLYVGISRASEQVIFTGDLV